MTNRVKYALCWCGNPQSYPIPHEHAQTEREKQIINYYKGKLNKLTESLQDFINDCECNNGKPYRGTINHANEVLSQVEKDGE